MARPDRVLARRHEPTHILSVMRGLMSALIALPLLLTALPGRAATPPGIAIDNTAAVSSAFKGISLNQNTNTVYIVTRGRTPSDLKLLQWADAGGGTAIPETSYSADGTATGSFTAIGSPPPPGALIESGVFHGGENIIIRLVDLDQNLDPFTLETVQVRVVCAATGDAELLRLTETGPATGEFLGYLPTSNSTSVGSDGMLAVSVSGKIDGYYTDSQDPSDTSVGQALVDPFGIVFDSATGTPLDKALVTLIDEATGLPATTVVGDNNAAGFPATIETGSTFVFAGITYANPPGGYRFPQLPPGSYRLEVTMPPAGYSAVSTVSAATLRERFGPTYEIATPGSFNDPFSIAPGPAIRIDIPLDPATTGLWLQKSASQKTAAVGDFLQYTLKIENTGAAVTAPAVTISDRLPLGFRYQKGSTRIDGQGTGDPVLSGEGRTMFFALGDLPPATTRKITYVIEVAAGVTTGQASNLAQATDALGNLSNVATATVTVRDEFFRNKSFLLGRVLVGGCDQPDSAMEGLAGVKIYLEDGSYVVTDKNGNYHFEGVEPGVHVVQADTFSLPHGYELIPCEQTTQSAGRSFSQFVDLRGGTLWRVNFYAAPLPAPTGELSLTLKAALEENFATFTATAITRRVPLKNLTLAVMLPGGFSYIAGSAQRDGQAITDPQATGDGLTFFLPALPADTTTNVIFRAKLVGMETSGELPVKAVLGFDSPTAKGQHTPPAETRFNLTAGQPARSEEIRLYPRFPSFVAELQETDRTMLEQVAARLQEKKIVRIDLVGHTDIQRITPKSRHIFADNQALSIARAQSVAELLKTRLDVPAEAFSVRGMGESLPVADNATEAGRALNRRVELYLVTETAGAVPELSLPVPASLTQSVSVTGVSPAAETIHAAQSKDEAEKISRLDPAKGLLSPADGKAVDRISAVRIRLDPKLKPRLTLDGVVIPEDRIGFRMVEKESKTTLYSYIGVDFGKPGEHTLLIEGLDPFGNARFKQEATVVRTGEIARIRLLEVAETLADGRTPVRIRMELSDLSGKPIQVATTLGLENSDLRPLGEKPLEFDANLGTLPEERTVEVDSQGWISFNPVDRSGRYPLRLTASGTVLDTEIYVKPQMRDWILVGFAQGTVGYNTINDNIISAEEAGIDEHGYTDGQVKFFAKGAIKGEWLLTLAYDSDKPDLDGDSLQQIIDPDTYYPLYGDETQQGYEAASARDIYVKLERDQFQALFGDMQTGLTQTVLSQYSRAMNGFKSELQSERFAYTVFAADTKQAFVKDELRGDGTSGRYPLSQQDLVINSEEVVIETRDRFHNERIVKEERLSRHVDYDIDFEAGTLFFKRPVPSKDENFNPVFIVVRYETAASDQANLNYGGRGAVKLLDGQVEVGASLIHEDNGAAEGDLYGADVTVKLTPQTTLRAEVAATDVEEIDDDRKGDAYLAEIEHIGEQLDGRAWFRQQDPAFGLGQQNGGTNGMRTYGVEGAYRFNPRWSLNGEAYHEDNLDTDARRDVATVEGQYRAERYSLMAGLREARDKFESSEKQTSRQLLLGGDWSTPDRKLTLRATHEQSLGGNNENSDFPTRTMIGADYRLTQSVSLFAEQEFTWGGREDTEGTRAGIKATPWQGGEVRTAVERQLAENGERIFALFGIGQNWQVTRRWGVDLSVDRSYTIKNKTNGERVKDRVPPASGGDDDFTAVSVGAAYTAERWSWWNRLETRQGDSEDKVGISSGVVGEVRDGVAVSAKLMAFITDSAGGGKRDEEEITLGMAYRPDRSKWIILERLDLSLYNEDGDSSDSDGMRIVNHLHASYRASRQWQTSFYYGLKYVRENFDGDRYDGYTDMIAIETRYNITNRWDVGIHGAVLHSWNSGQFDYSLGASVGYLVMTNAWISAGYNLFGFEDEDFSDANYTAEGPYMRFRMKFDQQSVKEAAAWLNR